MFPVAMLHGILQANDLVLEFLRTYLRQSLAILEQMQQPAPLAPFLAPMDWMRAMIPPSSRSRCLPAADPSPAGHTEELNARIAEWKSEFAAWSNLPSRLPEEPPTSRPTGRIRRRRRPRRWTGSRSD